MNQIAHDRHYENQRYYQNAKSRNVCVDCGAPAAAGCVRCSACLEARRLQMQNLTAQRQKHGQCVLCGRPIASGSSCRDCRDKVNASRLILRQKRISLGLCALCGKEPLASATRCASCLEKGRQRGKLYRQKRSQSAGGRHAL